jgi:hypothetical protein
VRDRRAEHGHHRVADELLHDPAVLLDAAPDHRVIELERVADVLRVGAIGPRRDLDQVDEQHGDELPLLQKFCLRELGAAAVAEPRSRRVLLAANWSRPAAGQQLTWRTFSRMGVPVRFHR